MLPQIRIIPYRRIRKTNEKSLAGQRTFCCLCKGFCPKANFQVSIFLSIKRLNGFNFQLTIFNLKIYFVNQYTPFSAFSPNAYSPFILPEIFFTFPVLSIW